MTVTPFHYAEASDMPRRILLQGHFSFAGIDLDDPANEDHRTWLELVAPQVIADLVRDYEQVMLGHIADAIGQGILAPGGFLENEQQRDAALVAALQAAVAEVQAS